MFDSLLGRSTGREFCESTGETSEAATGCGYLSEMGVVDGSDTVDPSSSDTFQSIRLISWSIQSTVCAVLDCCCDRPQHTLFPLGYLGSALRRVGQTNSPGKSRNGWNHIVGSHAAGDGCIFLVEGDEETKSTGSCMKSTGGPWVKVSVLLTLISALGCGAVKEKKVMQPPPAYVQARTATTQELVDLINDRYSKVDSITVRKCKVEFTGGSVDDGYLEKYRKANGLLIAQNPESIFVNILNPLTNSTVVMMASKNEQFQIWIPSKNTFVTGRTDVTPEEDNPIYNVRPSHILEGILIDQIPMNDPKYRFYVAKDEDEQFRYYVLGVVELKKDSSVTNLLRRVWIERSTMRLKRQQYYRGDEVVSNITYRDAVNLDGLLVNTKISIERPVDRYAISFELQSDDITLGRELKPDDFEIRQPAGSEVVVVD